MDTLIFNSLILIFNHILSEKLFINFRETLSFSEKKSVKFYTHLVQNLILFQKKYEFWSSNSSKNFCWLWCHMTLVVLEGLYMNSDLLFFYIYCFSDHIMFESQSNLQRHQRHNWWAATETTLGSRRMSNSSVGPA